MQQLHSTLYRHPVEDLIQLENVTDAYRYYKFQLKRKYSVNFLLNNRLKGSFACESDVLWGKIGYARDLAGRQQLIINSARFPQVHRLETCKYYWTKTFITSHLVREVTGATIHFNSLLLRYAEKRCEYLPPCYKSRCQQRFSHIHMMAVDPTKLDPEPYVDIFLVPSACSCFVENFIFF